MQQTFHKFTAPTLDEAYLAMRSRLGDEAVVVRTSTVTHGTLLGRLLGQKLVEVTASAPAKSQPVPPTRPLSAVERKYLAAAAVETGVIHLPSETPMPVGNDVGAKDRVAFFKDLVGETQQRINAAEGAHTRAGAPTGKPTPPVSPPRGSVAPAPVIDFDPPEAEPRRDASMAEIRGDIGEMREMLDVLTAEVPGAGLPQEFVPHYQMLVKRGVTKTRAAALVKTAAKRGDLRAFRQPRVFLERLKMEIRRHVAVTGGISLNADTRKVVALVGATGVGKTTNLAKLAALYTIQERARVGVITTDTYRVAATDQLGTYTDIIDLDMRIVHEPAEMTAALKDFADLDLVLIDTAGGSPFNREQMTDMRALLEAANPDEVHLVTSANVALDDLRDVVKHFSILRPTAMFFTKLDETRRYGPLYCLAAEAGLPVSYFSIGQNVPDDIIPASPATIAKLVVEGGEEIG